MISKINKDEYTTSILVRSVNLYILDTYCELQQIFWR